VLLRGIAPQTAEAKTPSLLVRSLRRQHGHQAGALAASSSALAQSSWLHLWRFYTGVSDLNTLTTQPHVSVYPTAPITKALLTLTLRSELLERASLAGARRVALADETALGASHRLISDIEALATGLGDLHKRGPLTVAAWRGAAHFVLSDFHRFSWLTDALQNDLTNRAGYGLINEEIGSIRRLRVTKGVYLPADVPMHAVCGSKDVIHS